jgi:flagellum-specific peptidoglycan hydrolase FlgJ
LHRIISFYAKIQSFGNHRSCVASSNGRGASAEEERSRPFVFLSLFLAIPETQMQSMQDAFLKKASELAKQAGHIWPDYAACEAALESGWGRSGLTVKANNLFGEKQSHPPLPGTGTLQLPTREFLHGAWVTVNAEWVVFPDWAASFRTRMDRLHRLANEYPAYGKALAATTGEEFVRQVSISWSTGPERAEQVLAVYQQHKAVFAETIS